MVNSLVQINTIMEEKVKLRDKLVDIALQWQASFGVAPSIITSYGERINTLNISRCLQRKIAKLSESGTI